MNKKMKALDNFINYLMRSKVKKNLAKIILFGSIARGEARKDSDIVLLIFRTGNLSDKRE